MIGDIIRGRAMTEEELSEIWKGDLLGFKERGVAFTNLVTSITDHRTISIEAGYGRGKTFFREAWAKQLEAAGECVVQIDARLSDHSGDPVVTFLGALLGMVPEQETKRRDAAFGMAKKIGIAGARAIGKAAFREGFDEVVDAVTPDDGETGSLHDIAKSVGQDLSKAAGDMIATQLEAEKARLELGKQLKLLHAQITKGRDTDQIIILIDELDRCHPDYAIALLEAMKLVFDQDGFVFVLLVDRDYLERIANHRFGGAPKDLKNDDRTSHGEFYLDKFVDLRLKLEAAPESLSKAAEALAFGLPLVNPFSDHQEFSLERASQLAGQLAPISELTMRQIKRALERVELACRLYQNQPIDAPLLVWLAFKDVANLSFEAFEKTLPKRFGVTPSTAERLLAKQPKTRLIQDENKWSSDLNFFVEDKLPELLTLSNEQLRTDEMNKDYYYWARVYKFLAPHYIPEHQAMLDAVHKLQADA
jgi:hypothetical protein